MALARMSADVSTVDMSLYKCRPPIIASVLEVLAYGI